MLILHTPFEVNSLATLGGRLAIETTKMGVPTVYSPWVRLQSDT